MTVRTCARVIMLFVLLSNSSISSGQFGGGGMGVGMSPVQEIKIFALETVSPAEAIKALTEVMKDLDPDSESSIRFSGQPNAKSLIAKGSTEDLKLVQALLMSIDPHPSQETSNKKFAQTLFTISPKHTAASAIELAMGAVSMPFTTHVDPRTNKLLIYGPAAEYNRVTELIETIDVPVKNEQRDIMIRFVWLVEKSLASDSTPAVPSDLYAPTEALRNKMSLGELRTAAQMLVQVDANGGYMFSASGTAKLKHTFSIMISGQITNVSSDQYRLLIETNTTGQGNSDSNRLTTQCQGVHPGQPVILGTTPIDSQASVFVIQILDK